MSISRQNGDKAAERKANVLALKAIEKGGPKVQQDFLQTLAKHEPEAAKAMAADMNLMSKPDATAGQKCEDLGSQIDFLKERMEKGAEQARKQMENLTKQQEQMEKLAAGGPEDFMKFMAEQGISDMDMQRIFGGDGEHMEKCLQGMIDKTVKNPDSDGRMENPEATIKAAEQLHRSICGDGLDDVAEVAEEIPDKPSTRNEDDDITISKPFKPKEDEVKIADHRLQYQKDDSGKYISVDLKCTLPGVASMDSIVLDVSEKHIRLSTFDPKYVVNAGPFPVLIEPGAAKAKFSKKRQELSISIPPKAS